MMTWCARYRSTTGWGRKGSSPSMASVPRQLTTWSGTDAVTRRKQSWARLMNSLRASALTPAISRAGRPAPSRCSESWASPSSTSPGQPAEHDPTRRKRSRRPGPGLQPHRRGHPRLPETGRVRSGTSLLERWSRTGLEVDPVGRLASADQDRGHHLRREQAVLDDPGRAGQPDGQRRRIVHRPLVVRDHAAVRAERDIAQRGRGDPAHGGAQPEGQQLEGNRAVQGRNRLGGVHDDDEPVRGPGDDLLPRVGAAAPLDQPAVRGNLVRAVDGEVEPVDARNVLDPQAQLARRVLGARRRGGAHDVERSPGQGREQIRHGRAGAQADGHAVLDQLRGRLRGDLLLSLIAHGFVPPGGCRDWAPPYGQPSPGTPGPAPDPPGGLAYRRAAGRLPVGRRALLEDDTGEFDA